ncbi:MAG: hypothetical protein KDA28_09815 [Phycisphaerales bacterium]|nr:hypothetical protein [Phycisphaerales bacterium]
MLAEVRDLEDALGQFVLYEHALRREEPDRTLYLAVPEPAWQEVFADDVGQVLLDDQVLRVVTFDPVKEELIRWIPDDVGHLHVHGLLQLRQGVEGGLRDVVEVGDLVRFPGELREALGPEDRLDDVIATEGGGDGLVVVDGEVGHAQVARRGGEHTAAPAFATSIVVLSWASPSSSVFLPGVVRASCISAKARARGRFGAARSCAARGQPAGRQWSRGSPTGRSTWRCRRIRT